MTDATDVANALLHTSKGTVKYDSDWDQEGRGKALLMHLGRNLAVLNVIPSVHFDDDGMQGSNYVNESLYTFTPESEGSQIASLSEYGSDADTNKPPKIILSPELVQTERALEMYEHDRQKKVQENIEAWKKHLEHQLSVKFSRVQQKSNFLAKMRLEQQKRAEKLKQEDEMRLKEIEEKKQQQIKEQHKVKAKILSEKIRNAELQHKAQQEEIQRLKFQEMLRTDLKTYCKDISVAAEQTEQIITSNISSDENLLKQSSHWLKQLAHVSKQAEQLQQLTQITKEDVQSASLLKADTLNLCKYISDKVVQTKALIEENKKHVNDAKASVSGSESDDQAAKSVDGESRASHPTKTASTDHEDDEALKEYENIITFHKKVEGAYQSLVKDEKLKKYKFDLQKAVNTPVNAISAYSGAHLRDKFERLLALISGQMVEVGEKRINCKQHPQAIFYCMDLLAKKLVMQGEGQIASKFETAFPVAVIIVGLWSKFPEFGRLILYHLYERCPYLLPYYPEDSSKQRPLGHEELKRVSGYVRLYAAILQSSPPLGVNSPNPHGIEYGWRWITRVLNTEPRLDITATILFDFLEVVGHAMQTTYGNQFQKLLYALCKDYFPKIKDLMPSGSGGGPYTRLEGLLQKVVRQRTIPPPEGLLKPSFWNTF